MTKFVVKVISNDQIINEVEAASKYAAKKQAKRLEAIVGGNCEILVEQKNDLD